MAPDGIVEPVDVAANGLVGLLAGVEDGPPDELGFQGLEERLDHGVVVAIPLAGHRDQYAVLLELGLIIDRAILGGFKRSSQHGVWWPYRSHWSSASAGVFQSSVFRGLALRAAATAPISLALCMLRSVPFGKYCRSSPLVFSLVPRCHGLCGSQK